MKEYESLQEILKQALIQSADGKGKERHAKDGQRFEDQPIVTICLNLGSNDFALGQMIKKGIESKRLPWDRARRELLGSIVYAAAAVIVGDKLYEVSNQNALL